MSGSSDVPESYRSATIATASKLRNLAGTTQSLELSRLSLPDVDRLADEIGRVLPAGNVPAMIFGGLAKLRGRRVASTDVAKHIQLLFMGARQTLDEAVYAAFFAGPAAVLYGYQQLLRLAGKDADAAFPDGTWQFYLEYALRQDSARHANETGGFHEQITRYGLRLRPEDTLAAWVLAVTYFIRQLPDLLANEWREPVALGLLADLGAANGVKGIPDRHALGALWSTQRPYRRDAAAAQEDYPTYRRRVFDAFTATYVALLPTNAKRQYTTRLNQLGKTELPAYQRQLSWLASLEPGIYGETRVPYPAEEASLGVIWQGRYFLLPLAGLVDPEAARSAVAAVLACTPGAPATLDEALVTARREEHPALREQLAAPVRRDLALLNRVPVLINWDERDQRLPLALIRRGKRGVGDHALTIFRTAGSIVLDQSHIFFDGGWGAAVAEILTNEALSWARYLAELPPAAPAAQLPISPVLQVPPGFAQQALKAAIRAETSAESDAVRIKPILALRKLLKQRSDLAQLTVNDLFILYRGLHAFHYRPSSRLQEMLDRLAADPRPAAKQAHKLVRDSLARLQTTNPALLIPVDARPQNPRERIFPTTFRNPFTDFLDLHRNTLDALHAYRRDAAPDRSATFQAFFQAQLHYLRLLGGFGELLARYKAIALAGQSTSTATIKLMGHLPEGLRKVLDALPSRFDVLNEIIKGEEVFSNVGRVAKGSTLRRFTSARDDNDQKTLIWGVITDDDDTVRVSLRDFRPHVDALHALGMADLAQAIAQDYLDRYADGLNLYVAELREITVASRETQPHGKG